jgi:spermidine/putrescine transport system ATP-binding protein
LTVYENVAFGLKMAKVPKADIPARVEEALAMVRLDGFAKRKPDQLSGGQRQRVAIARAVVNKPKVLLLDESFSALDYKLRLQMQIELKQLQRRLGITFVYVTHDQEEALSMSDRILVMENGMPMQVGTPRQIYEAPDNLFVAKFIGEINIFDAIIEEELPSYKYKVTLINETYKQTPTEELHTINIATDRRFDIGTKVHILLRPEDLRIEYLKYAGERPGFLGNVLERNYTGKTLDSLIELDSGLKIKASEFFDEDDPDFDYSINERVWVDWVHGWEHVIAAE